MTFSANRATSSWADEQVVEDSGIKGALQKAGNHEKERVGRITFMGAPLTKSV